MRKTIITAASSQPPTLHSINRAGYIVTAAAGGHVGIVTAYWTVPQAPARAQRGQALVPGGNVGRRQRRPSLPARRVGAGRLPQCPVARAPHAGCCPDVQPGLAAAVLARVHGGPIEVAVAG